MPRHVIFIGRVDAPEFQSPIAWLEEHVVFRCVEDIVAATDSLHRAAADTILVAPSHRSEFTLQQVRQLQAASPLSHFYVIVGSWCEGETRSGKAWPGIERLYVNQLIPRARSDGWDREPIGPTTPCTASSDERWMGRAARSKTDQPGFVLVCGRDKESRLSLVELCRWAGFQSGSMKSPRGQDGNPLAIIYDADRNRQQRIRDLQRLSHGLPDARIVTLIEYPRHDEISQALDAGSNHVLGKPYDIDDLLTLLLPANRTGTLRLG